MLLYLLLPILILLNLNYGFAEEVDETTFKVDVESRAVKATGAGKSCTTHDSRGGTCVPMDECNVLYGLLRNSFSDDSVQKILRTSISRCNMNNSNKVPYVCCKSAGTTTTRRPEKTTESVRSIQPVSSVPHCGNSSVRSRVKIIAGQPAELGAWPWLTALYCSDGGKKTAFQCGGALISDQWVLTASHCLTCPNKQLKLTHVRVGDLNLDDKVDDKATPITIPIKKILKHPDYREVPIQNDIALLQLSKPVKFTNLIYPICIQSGEVYESDSHYESKKPFIAGWGSTEYGNPVTSRLMEVTVPVANISTCKEAYSKYHNEAVIDSRVICAGDGKRDSCSGDSGGPLMFANALTRSYYVGGVVSFGIKCAEKDFPGVYTKVALFIDWINKSTGLNF